MNTFEWTFMIWLGSMLAGFLGSLTGLGGGVVIVPMLALGFGIDIRYAAGASLVAVIATSSGAAAAYVKEGFSNIRIGMFLEVATTLGALVGAFVTSMLSTGTISILFGVILVYSAFLSIQKRREGEDSRGNQYTDPLAVRLKLNGSYPVPIGSALYQAQNVAAGFALMFGAGILSGLLGIGSGALKVLAMDRTMRLPFKVSTTTSNFMIGVTAAASAGIYFSRGYIDPGLSMPVMLGVLPGALLGARQLVFARPRHLRLLFTGVILMLAVEMIYKGWTGRF
ncbi:MAG: sulfite exporter TauE/SafE family protein [Candidatus Manganitrophus sp.]|nr:sulfite exporter TauE/SafE family protein [Candidatus Manganitrophus sp.]WDT82339.1 MAG: sulfite exporter TauE/SafE family protein [Candidatus Manganitrophus sp.]